MWDGPCEQSSREVTGGVSAHHPASFRPSPTPETSLRLSCVAVRRRAIIPLIRNLHVPPSTRSNLQAGRSMVVGVCERQPSSGFDAHIQTQLASLHTNFGNLLAPQFRCPLSGGDFRGSLAFEQATHRCSQVQHSSCFSQMIGPSADQKTCAPALPTQTL